MSFFSTALKVVGIGAAVLTGVGAIAGGAAALGGVLGSSTLAGLSLPISTGLTSAIAAGSSAISSFITPISTAINGAAQAVNTIQDQIINPILQPISAVVNSTNAVIAQIHTDLQGGFAGIAQIPGQITAALTSVDATFSRAAIALGATNSAIVDQQLAPALLLSGATPMKALGDVIQSTFNPPPGQLGKFDEFKLPTNATETDLLKRAREYEARIANPTTWYDKVIANVYYNLFYLIASTSAVLPDTEEIEQMMRAAKPTRLIGINDLIQADLRGEITTADAMVEARKQGIAETRYAILKELAFDVPSTQTAAVWLAQGLIKKEDYDRVATDNGVPVADKDLIYNGQFKPPSVASIIAVEGKERAAAAGFLASTLNQAPPSQLVDFYQANLIDKRQATLDWVDHWQIPPITWFIEAFHRGKRSHTDVLNAATVEAIPPELIEDMIEVSRPRPRATMFKSMFDKGIINASQYQTILGELGYSAPDTVLLVKLAEAEKPVTVAAQYHELKSLSLSTADGLYADGAIDSVQYQHVLVGHGFSPEAATLQQKYADLKHERDNRKAKADQLVADVVLGNSTIDSAVSALHADGFTDREVLRYQKQMITRKSAAVKYPSIAEVGTMFKRGIVDEQTFRDFLTQQNFAPEWIDNFVALELSAPAKTAKSGSTSTAGA